MIEKECDWRKEQFNIRLICRDYNMLLVLYKDEWFHLVDCCAEFLNNTYKKTENIDTKQRKFVQFDTSANSIDERDVFLRK